jgi:hypothetical protein
MKQQTLNLCYTGLRYLEDKILDVKSLMRTLDGDFHRANLLDTYYETIKSAREEIEKTCSEVEAYKSPYVKIIITKELNSTDMLKEPKL